MLRAALATCLLFAVSACLAWNVPAALAAEVSVREAPGDPNTAELTYTAGAEDNRLSVTRSPEHGFGRLIVADPGAEIDPGSGCTAADQDRTVVYCALHEPKSWDYLPCGKSCFQQIPGTAWSTTMRIELGEGENAFDGSSFSGIFTEGVGMTVTSGAGADRIATGGGEDLIDPGAGSDVVITGEGFDELIATALPDGPDLYQSGSGSTALLSYARRSTPVELRGTSAGAPAEGDLLAGHFYVAGGSAGDRLEGGPNNRLLDGGPGDDVISGSADSNTLYGGPGDDVLRGLGTLNLLFGEEGNDLYEGSEATDLIRDFNRYRETGGSTPEPIPSAEDGDDRAHGNGGSDVIELGLGSDEAWGGAGHDQLHGGVENDGLRGGVGRDLLIGDQGLDLLWGGHGADRIFASRWRWRSREGDSDFPFQAVLDDATRDHVRCGLGADFASVNRRDRTSACERLRVIGPAR